MKIIKIDLGYTKDTFSQIARVLDNHGLVVLPTDTVYGLSVLATNTDSVSKLIAFKNRPVGKAISVFIPSLEDLSQYVHASEAQKKMVYTIFPGPFTAVLASNHGVDSHLEAEDGTLGIRLPNTKFLQDFMAYYKKPITATSANLAGGKPHYSVESLLESLSEKKKAMIDLVVDAGKLPFNKPSTVINLVDDQPKTLRAGDVNIEKTEHFLSKNEADTKKFAEIIFKKYMSADMPTVFLLSGNLGAGKTQFVKSVGAYLGLNDIISPTFVIYYEYEVNKKNIKNLYHFDLYTIEKEEELDELKIADLIKPGNVIFMEWGEKIGSRITILKTASRLISVTIDYVSETERDIQIVPITRL